MGNIKKYRRFFFSFQMLCLYVYKKKASLFVVVFILAFPCVCLCVCVVLRIRARCVLFSTLSEFITRGVDATLSLSVHCTITHTLSDPPRRRGKLMNFTLAWGVSR